MASESLEIPVSDIAEQFADRAAKEYLGNIAMNDSWMATEEQLLNPKGYFGAQRRVGVDNAEFIERISKPEQAG